ncbi:MAG: hypothetical protein SGBAC_008901 [Bacillariaceae sp.]
MQVLSHYLYLLLLLVVIATGADAKKSWADIAKEPKLETTETTCTVDETIKTAPPVKKSPPKLHSVYSKLPPKSTGLLQVRNVYDGDTLTLKDGRRIRLRGIDTPEMEPREPFAAEAKAYARQYCHKRSIHLDISGEDHYGRLIADVWVETADGNFLNVNEGLVAAGLATVYLAQKNDKPPNFKKLVALQNQARLLQLGLWKDFKDRNVVITRNGAAFHEPTCKHLANVRSTKILTQSQALDQGLHPCRTCMNR